MATPWKLITHKSDPWHVKLKKWVARWLWEDLTKLPKPAKGYPDPDKDARTLAEKIFPGFDIKEHFASALKKAQEEDKEA